MFFGVRLSTAANFLRVAASRCLRLFPSTIQRYKKFLNYANIFAIIFAFMAVFSKVFRQIPLRVAEFFVPLQN
jgi:hypothetical protein